MSKKEEILKILNQLNPKKIHDIFQGTNTLNIQIDWDYIAEFISERLGENND